MKSLRGAFHARRLAGGMTQEEAARAALVTRKTVSDFENGKGSISAANFSRLLTAVGLELAVREASRRPTLDELAARYTGEELPESPRRRRARRRSS